MATCPRCKGHLTEFHRCPRRATFVAAEIVLWALTGIVAGCLLVALFDRQGQITDEIYLASGIAGMLVAVGMNRALKS